MNVKPGGTEGGVILFFGGVVLAALAVWFFFDSVIVTTAGHGWLSGAIGGHRGGGAGNTASMGVLFVPLVLGLIILFYNAKSPAGWILTGLGVVILVIEILSRVRFAMSLKTTHLILMFVMFAAGIGMLLRGYLADRSRSKE